MQYLHELFKLDNSRVALGVRWSLYGLRSALQQVLTDVPDDPGCQICQAFLQDLDRLLDSVPWDNGQLETRSIVETRSAHSALTLKPIAEAMQNDPKLSLYLGSEEHWQSTTDSELWSELQRFLLRVPESLARVWRSQLLKFANQLGAKQDGRKEKSLPFSPTEEVYPGLNGSIIAQGWHFSKPRETDDLKILENIVKTCLQWIDDDPNLHHALDRFLLLPLTSPIERDRYESVLLDRLDCVRKSATDPVLALRNRIHLDEAIHSLIYLPPVDRSSWWGKLRQEARRTLESSVQAARAAGHQVQTRPLWQTYAEIYKYSKDDLRIETGIPGEVSTCLRVYARIDDEVLPGRVLYRSK